MFLINIYPSPLPEGLLGISEDSLPEASFRRMFHVSVVFMCLSYPCIHQAAYIF